MLIAMFPSARTVPSSGQLFIEHVYCEREEEFHLAKKTNIAEVLETSEFSNCDHGAIVDERERLGLRLDPVAQDLNVRVPLRALYLTGNKDDLRIRATPLTLLLARYTDHQIIASQFQSSPFLPQGKK